jgi:hypothetical protein
VINSINNYKSSTVDDGYFDIKLAEHSKLKLTALPYQTETLGFGPLSAFKSNVEKFDVENPAQVARSKDSKILMTGDNIQHSRTNTRKIACR